MIIASGAAAQAAAPDGAPSTDRIGGIPNSVDLPCIGTKDEL
jgi:hypothetical protein